MKTTVEGIEITIQYVKAEVRLVYFEGYETISIPINEVMSDSVPDGITPFYSVYLIDTEGLLHCVGDFSNIESANHVRDLLQTGIDCFWKGECI